MTAWGKVAAVFVAASLFFGGGFWVAAQVYKRQIAEMEAEQALAIKEKTDEYRSKEQAQAAKLAQAIDALAKARANAVDLGADLERVRKLADSYRARLPAADGGSCGADRERLARCVSLLSEGAELSAEGARISEEIASKKDALSIVRRIK